MDNHLEWLKIARSNLQLGKIYSKVSDEDIRFEELCFELQQCAEKSLKALLVFHNINFRKIHVISELLGLLIENNITVPEEILLSAKLTQYAVETRYPDDFVEVNEQEYFQTVEIAENVYNWVKEQIK
jgi:HEPN domain-containing protein